MGIEASRIFVDEKPGTTIDRPGLRAALAYAREGDALVVQTLDRLLCTCVTRAPRSPRS